jgi:hypothetical protein
MQLNLVLAWLWIALGIIGGFGLGLFFHREDWLGGYASLTRRLYRLAHISFFGLAILNILFYLTAREIHPDSPAVLIASYGFIAGAVSMPVCCGIMAHRPQWRALFLIPVSSLIVAVCLTLWEVAKL